MVTENRPDEQYLAAYQRAGEPLELKDIEAIIESTQVIRAKFIVDVYFRPLKPQMDRVSAEFIPLGEMHGHAIHGEAVEEEVISAARKSFRLEALRLQQGVINELKKYSD